MGRVLATVLGGSVALAGMLTVAPPASAAGNDLFAPYTATMPGSWPKNVAMGDVTGDGRPDVVLTTTDYFDPAHDYSLFVYPQRADGTLGAPTQVATGTTSGRMGIALADLDGDGHLDAAVSTADGVRIYLQTGGGLSYAWTVPVADAEDIRLADLDGNGSPDLVANTTTGIEVWWGVAGDFLRGPTLSSTYHREVDTGDVTGDGLPDVVAATNSGVEVYAQQPDRAFAPPASYTSGGVAPWTTVEGLAVGDTNGDGLADVHLSVGGNKPNSWVITRFQQPDGTLGAPYARASYDIPEALEVADVTGDGRNDLVVAHGGWNRVGVYDSTPGTAPSEALYAVPYASHYANEGLAVGDVTGDGRADVALGDYNNGLVMLRGVAPGADVTAPQTTITGGTSGTVTTRSASFAFAADEPATFECSLDQAAWSACTSRVVYDGLAQGSHSFAVRATDTAGNTDQSPATRTFTVDGPDTTITSGPTGTVQSTSASFGFSGASGTASYQCALDDGPWQPCTSPAGYDGLRTGTSHAFKVRAVTADGLVDSTPALRSWNIDSAADLAVTLTAPSAVKKGGTLTWTTTVANVGPQGASGSTVTVGLPSGFQYGSVTAAPSASTTATASCSASGSPATVRCALGTVDPGLRWTVSVTGTVTVAKGALAATAAAAGSTWDLDGTNDSASASVTVGNGRG